MKSYGLASTILALLTLSAATHADPPFVCGTHMIESGEGTTKEEVLAKCGPPTFEDGIRWVYENQPGQKTVIVHFDGDTVSLIQEVLK